MILWTYNFYLGALDMKKQGFTLAEVLITLGIVGVVAALTAPALVQNAGSAQVGPKLAKAVNTFEVANENLLNDTGAATVVASGATSGSYSSPSDNYIDYLSNYMKINYTDESNVTTMYQNLIFKYDGKDIDDGLQINEGGASGPPSIRINSIAIKAAASHIGLSKDGMLYGVQIANDFEKLNLGNGVNSGYYERHQGTESFGSTAHKQQLGTVIIDINGYAKPNRLGKDLFAFYLMADGSLLPVGTGGTWNNGDSLCNESEVTTGDTCAGSIFENNLKVIYQ